MGMFGKRHETVADAVDARGKKSQTKAAVAKKVGAKGAAAAHTRDAATDKVLARRLREGKCVRGHRNCDKHWSA